MRLRTALAAAVALSVPAASGALAITDEEILRALRVSTLAPGARATAMGGASLALVDDATACRINPARMVAITSPEAVIELRHRSWDDVSTESGPILFEPQSSPFAGTTLSDSSEANSGTTLSYLSYAHPIRLKRPLVLGISRSLAIDVSAASRVSTRTTPLSAPTPGDEIIRDSIGELEADITLYDLAAGWRMTPTFSVGGALVVGMLDVSSSTTGVLTDPLQFTLPGMADPRFSGPGGAPLVVMSSGGTDSDLGFSFGVQWRPHTSLWLATVYRSASEFEIRSTHEDLFAGGETSFSNVIRTPDSAAIGLAWTPFAASPSSTLQSLVLALDVERVGHSETLKGLRVGESILTSPYFVSDVSYDLEDSVEGRLGLEVRKTYPTWTLALRGGAYTEHAGVMHLEEMSGDVGQMQGQSDAMKRAGYYAEGDTELHGTMGAGARFYSFSFDVGVDFSDPLTQIVASATYRFR